MTGMVSVRVWRLLHVAVSFTAGSVAVFVRAYPGFRAGDWPFFVVALLVVGFVVWAAGHAVGAVFGFRHVGAEFQAQGDGFRDVDTVDGVRASMLDGQVRLTGTVYGRSAEQGGRRTAVGR